MKNINKKVLKNSNGITLIALVITIIVLLILAGISISMLSGNNGILQRATDAKIETEKGEVYEQINLATASGEMEYYSNGTDRIIAYKNALLNGVDGIDRDKLSDNGSNLITGTVTKKSGKQYDFSVPVPMTDITVAEHHEKVIELTSVYAKLYNDGTLILSSTDYTDSSKTLTKDFGLVENKNASNYWSASDYNTLVTKVSFYDEIAPSSTAYYFTDLTNLTSFENMSKLETSLVTDMKSMFAGCTSLTSIDVSHFNTSNVTNMSGMFEGSYKEVNEHVRTDYYYEGRLRTLDLRNFDTSKVTSMSSMFAYQVSLESVNLSSFDTSNVTSMYRMFMACASLTTLDLSSFNTSNVTVMGGMFTCSISENSNALYIYYNNSTTTRSSLTTIYVSDLWDISKVRRPTVLADHMFRGCVSLVGAISYDSSKDDQTYANYTTGYLTYKSNS